MIRQILTLMLFLFAPLGASAQTYTLDEDYGKVPVTFVPNVGQFDSTLAFIVEGNNGNKLDELNIKYATFPIYRFGSYTEDGIKREYPQNICLALVSGSLLPDVTYSDQKPWNTNYFLGDDPERWRTDVPNYQTLAYHDIFDGIDLRIRGEARNVIFELVVQPGADPQHIVLQNIPTDYFVKGISEDGILLAAHTIYGDAPGKNVTPPVCFQMIDGQKVPIDLVYRYIDEESGIIGFSFGEYDAAHELIIQPELVDSNQWTYRGVGEVFDIIADDNNNLYAAAKAVFYPYRIVPDYEALFAIKMNEQGDGLVYITYFGIRGQYLGYVSKIEVDNTGCLYIGGSFNAPVTPDAYSSGSGDDVSVIKLNLNGNTLLYSTDYGGTNSEIVRTIHLAQDGSIWITGETYSEDFPTTANAIMTEYLGNRDMFISHLNADGSNILYSTYFGGDQWEDGITLTSDAIGDVLVCGMTMSEDIPLIGNVLKSQKGADGSDIVFIKIDDQYNVVLSTYFGGNKSDVIDNIVSDSSGNMWMTGSTESDDFPTTDNSKNLTGEIETVLMRLSNEGIVDFSTILSSSNNYHFKMYVGENDTVWITGGTSTPNFPSPLGDAQVGRYLFLLGLDPADGTFTQTSLIESNAWYAYYFKALNSERDLFFVDTVSEEGDASPLFDDYGTIRKASPDYAVYVEDAAEHPMTYIIYPPYPNPFNATVTIQYQVLKQDHLKLAIYNALGQHVDTLIDRNMAPGLYSVHWDASEYSSGVYYYRVTSGNGSLSGKMMLLK